MDLFQIKAREPLFFMHIPKTAGMSMRLYLREQYQLQDICPAERWRDLLAYEQQLPSFRLVQGHFRYNLRQFLAPDARILVMLRDPLRRTISALRHLQRDPDFHADHELTRGLTLPEMIRHPTLIRNQRNVQARYLCASRTPEQIKDYLHGALPANPNADGGTLEVPPQLKLATDRLEAIDFVGLTENIGALVSAMAQAMNYHPPLHFPFINANPDPNDPLRALSDEDLAILRENNDIDLQIYDYAKRLIERRAFERDMHQLIQNGVYTVPLGSFEIPLSGVMPGSGWYAPEEQNGAFWRWTGPGRGFTIEVPLREDKSYRLTMRIGSLRPLAPEDLVAEVNDVPVAFNLLPDGGGYLCELVVWQDLLIQRSGFCRIRFETSKTTTLPPPEIRTLGVSVSQIVFECQDA